MDLRAQVPEAEVSKILMGNGVTTKKNERCSILSTKHTNLCISFIVTFVLEISRHKELQTLGGPQPSGSTETHTPRDPAG